MMSRVRAFGTFLAAALLTLCVGLQVLEASGQWDRTLQDSGDEAVIVAVVLCLGSALIVARALREQFSVARVAIRRVVLSMTASRSVDRPARLPRNTSPPVSLRI
jgi:hypothetical protein